MATEFAAEEQCLAYLEKARWPDGVHCLMCGNTRVSRISTKEGVRSKKYLSKKDW